MPNIKYIKFTMTNKNGQRNYEFGDRESEKHKFQFYKSPILLEDVDVNNILASNKIFSSERKNNYNYLIGYLCSDYKVKPRHIMLQKKACIMKVMIIKLNGCRF